MKPPPPLHVLLFHDRFWRPIRAGTVRQTIRRVAAIAQDPGSTFGPITSWSAFILPELRGDPEKYRCKVCEEVCCGEDHETEVDPFDEDLS